MACPGQHVYTQDHFFKALERIPYPQQEYNVRREALTDDLRAWEVYGTPYGFVHLCNVFTIHSSLHPTHEYAILHAKHVDTGVERIIIKPIPPRREWDSLEQVLAPTGIVKGAYILTVDTSVPPDESVILKGEQWQGIPYTHEAIRAWQDFLFPFTFNANLPTLPYELEEVLVRTGRSVYTQEGWQSDFFPRYTRLSRQEGAQLKSRVPDPEIPFEFPYAHVIFYHLLRTFQLGDLPRIPSQRKRARTVRQNRV